MTSPLEAKPNPDPTEINLDTPESKLDAGCPSWTDTVKDFLGREVRYLANPLNIGTGICVVAGVISSVAIVAFLGIAALSIAAVALISLGVAGAIFLVHARRAEQSRELHVHLNKLHEAIEGKVDISLADRAMAYINEHKSSHSDRIETLKGNLEKIKTCFTVPQGVEEGLKELQKTVLLQIADLKIKLHPIRDHVEQYLKKFYA